MTAGPTYTPIATTTLDSSASAITFSLISSDYTDLILTANLRSTKTSASTDTFGLQFNSDTNSNYSSRRLMGDGSSGSSNGWSNLSSLWINEVISDTGTVGNFSPVVLHINSYSNTNLYKSVLYRNSEFIYVTEGAGLWRSTNAISSISIISAGGFNVKTGSSATLYGITAA